MTLLRPLLAALAIAIVGTVLALILAGAIAAEAALHPVRRRAASNCPLIHGADCVSVAVTAADGVPLRGWFFRPRANGNGAAVLVLHGVGDWRASMVGLASMLAQHGYAVLTPDLRGHGESGGICTYGVEEVKDVEAWTEWLERSAGTRRIYGLGESLGAAVLIVAAPHEPRLRGIVAECAYSSFRDVAKERSLRAVAWWLRWAVDPFLSAGLASARMRHGVDLRRASPAEAIRETRVPVILIHGDNDNETAPENSRRIAAANPAVTRLWLVPGAGHTTAWSAAGAEFERRILEFFQSR